MHGRAQQMTGIGQYTVNLLEAMSALAPEEVRPICWRQQRDRFGAMGLRPWSPWRGRLYRDWLLPRADIVALSGVSGRWRIRRNSGRVEDRLRPLHGVRGIAPKRQRQASSAANPMHPPGKSRCGTTPAGPAR